MSSQSEDWGLERWEKEWDFEGELWEWGDEEEEEEEEEGGDEGDAEEVGEEALRLGDSDLTPATVT